MESGGLVTEAELIRSLTRIETKLDDALARVADHEERIRVQEQQVHAPDAEHAAAIVKLQEQMADMLKWRWRMTGAALGGGGLGGVLGAVVAAIVGG